MEKFIPPTEDTEYTEYCFRVGWVFSGALSNGIRLKSNCQWNAFRSKAPAPIDHRLLNNPDRLHASRNAIFRKFASAKGLELACNGSFGIMQRVLAQLAGAVALVAGRGVVMKIDGVKRAFNLAGPTRFSTPSLFSWLICHSTPLGVIPAASANSVVVISGF